MVDPNFFIWKEPDGPDVDLGMFTRGKGSVELTSSTLHSNGCSEGSSISPSYTNQMAFGKSSSVGAVYPFGQFANITFREDREIRVLKFLVVS